MKGTVVFYVDPQGAEHEALVRAQNPRNPDYLDLVYVDTNADESDNIRTVFGIVHMDHESKQEVQTKLDKFGVPFLQGNPHLPTIHLNCWKETYRLHNAPGAEYVAEQKALPQADGDPGTPSAADLDAVAAEQKAAELTSGPVLVVPPAPTT